MTGDNGGSDPTWGTEGEPRRDGTATAVAKGVPEGRDRPDLLGRLRRVETVADRAEFGSIRAELPEGWSVGPELVQFGSAALAETVAFERAGAGPRLLLKPVDDADPGGAIELYERPDPRGVRRLVATVDSLPAALRAAINRAHQLT